MNDVKWNKKCCIDLWILQNDYNAMYCNYSTPCFVSTTWFFLEEIKNNINFSSFRTAIHEIEEIHCDMAVSFPQSDLTFPYTYRCRMRGLTDQFIINDRFYFHDRWWTKLQYYNSLSLCSLATKNLVIELFITYWWKCRNCRTESPICGHSTNVTLLFDKSWCCYEVQPK